MVHSLIKNANEHHINAELLKKYMHFRHFKYNGWHTIEHMVKLLLFRAFTIHGFKVKESIKST